MASLSCLLCCHVELHGSGKSWLFVVVMWSSMGMASLGCSCCHVRTPWVWQVLAVRVVIMWSSMGLASLGCSCCYHVELHGYGKSWLFVLSCGSSMGMASLGCLLLSCGAPWVWQVLAVRVVMWELHGYGKSWLFVLSCGNAGQEVDLYARLPCLC